MPPAVLRAQPHHLDALAPLFDAYRQFYRQPSNLDAARRFLANRLEADESVIFLARLPGAEAFAGFTQLYPFFSSVRMRRVWVLNDLYVAPEARRSGVARALMDAARDFARDDGAASLELATETSNARAQALYDDLGYERETDYWHYALALDS